MCGIWACIGSCRKDVATNCTAALVPRGPEGMRVVALGDGAVTLGFTRLAINGLTEAGMQPCSDMAGDSWVCNGEIYNWRELAERHQILVDSGESDCHILGGLWAACGRDPVTFFRALDGVFAIVLVDTGRREVLVGRDPYGVRPLFIGQNAVTGVTMFASELKALGDCQEGIRAFPPGHYAHFKLDGGGFSAGAVRPYHSVPWLKNPVLEDVEQAAAAVRLSLRAAVKKRLMTERPCAALLSGGVDSSLICALVQQELKAAGKPALKTFSIGFAGSTDLAYARKVAEHIGSDHTEIISTPDEFFAAIPEVVQAIESYDITTVRASVGNWMVCKEIAKRTDCKVVFNGDGSDEVFGSYLYFFRAPSDEEFEAESGRLLEDIHMYDVLRSDRSISSHGLEARTPFLDKQFVAVARSIPTRFRRPRKPVLAMERSAGEVDNGLVEKWILRWAFQGENLLPVDVLWRQKEAFSDGVSGAAKAWYEEIRDRVGAANSAANSAVKYTYLPPPTPEAHYYRDLFEEVYGPHRARILKYFWMPKWSGETADPSARTLSFYSSSKKASGGSG